MTTNTRWHHTESVFLVNDKPLGIVYRGDNDQTWFASVGEIYSNDVNDSILEVEDFTTKDAAQEWIVNRLIHRGYI